MNTTTQPPLWDEGREKPTRLPRWAKCPCGKVRSDTKEEAKKKRREIAKIKGNHNEVRYYQCSTGSWHWTSEPAKSECPCGVYAYPDQSSASRAVTRRNEKTGPTAPVRHLAYQCPHGGHHAAVYTYARFRQCQCGQVAYPDETAAGMVRRYRLAQPGSTSSSYITHTCEHGSVHLTSWSRLNPDAITT